MKTRKKFEPFVKYTKEEVITFIKQISEQERNLATIGHILRDKYLILNLRDYGIRLKNYVTYTIDYELYTKMKKIVKLIKHIQKYPNDISNRVTKDELVQNILATITIKKRDKKIPANFKWTQASNEKLVGKYAR